MTTQQNGTQNPNDNQTPISPENTSVAGTGTGASPANPGSGSETPATPSKGIVGTTDKEVILDDLKKTMHDMGRIPSMLMAPVITYIAAKWETIPEERRGHLQRIVHDIKGSGSNGRHSLKDRFSSKHQDTQASDTAAATTTNTTSTSSTSTASDTTPTDTTKTKTTASSENKAKRLASRQTPADKKTTQKIAKTTSKTAKPAAKTTLKAKPVATKTTSKVAAKTATAKTTKKAVKTVAKTTPAKTAPAKKKTVKASSNVSKK